MGSKVTWTQKMLDVLPRSRGDALASGSIHYFNGSLCKRHQHFCPRMTASGKCHYCLRESARLKQRRLRDRPDDEKPLRHAVVKNSEKHGLSRSFEQMLYNSAKQRAKKRGLEFNISVRDITIPDRCPILKMKLNKVWGSSRQNNTNRANVASLDRIDPSKGYVKGNILVVSYRANLLKGNGTAEEHRKIGEFLKLINL